MRVRRLALGGALLTFAACAAPIGAGPDRPTSPTASVAIAEATPLASFSVEELPRVELSGVQATAVCDPEPAQANVDAGETTIFCSDALRLAASVVRTVTADPPIRLYLHRPACAAMPCSDDELSTADVAAWTASGVFGVHVDSRLEAIEQPSPIADGGWPEVAGATAPEVARPTIKTAPHEVAARTPFPWCGRAEVGEPPEVAGCFRAAVLDGRPAEMIEQVYGTEGGPVLWIYRYDGHGRIVRFQHDTSVNGDGSRADSWSRSEGAMILGIDSSGWSFEPWEGTPARL
jgi:hypothetical protein